MIVKGGVQPECLLALDEIGIQLGYEPRQQVVGGKGKKLQYAIGDRNKEMVIVIETIVANGKALSPIIIFKRKYFMESWLLQDNPLNTM